MVVSRRWCTIASKSSSKRLYKLILTTWMVQTLSEAQQPAVEAAVAVLPPRRHREAAVRLPVEAQAHPLQLLAVASVASLQ